jgi:hypothetical protein
MRREDELSLNFFNKQAQMKQPFVEFFPNYRQPLLDLAFSAEAPRLYRFG